MILERKEPWPHQEEIIELARHSNVFLADDTGTGKTISCIESIRYQWSDDHAAVLPAPILVICIKPAVLQWVSTIIQQYPGDPVHILRKGDKAQFQKLRRTECWIVTHFHTFHDKILYQYVLRQVFAGIVIDEAHRIKDYKTLWAVRIRNLKARRKIAATATDREKSVADMFNILQFLRGKKEYPSYWEFVERYCITTENYFSDNPDIMGTNPQMMPEFAERIAPFYRRRMKDDVRDDMPPLIEENVPVMMEKPQERFYETLERSDDILVWDDSMLDEPLIIANKLSLLIRLWQAATFPETVPGSRVKKSGKIIWVEEFINDNPKEKLIIFTYFRDTAKYLAKKFSNLPPYMGGHDNPLPTPDDQIVVGTIGSMGESLDLPWIDTAIFVNRSRSTIQMKQAKDRIYRMNIDNAKRAIYLESYKQSGAPTIDKVIREGLEKKWSDSEFVAAAIRELQQSVT